MAKSKSFFGVRKGSTKSHTYSVYHGQQITKDRWTQVKNPQTDAQMRQRMIVKMVANMRSQLKDTLQNTFEGLSGQEALRKFTSENCKKGAITPISWVKKDEMSAGVADYIVSDGTLEGYTYENGMYQMNQPSTEQLDTSKTQYDSSTEPNNLISMPIVLETVEHILGIDEENFLIIIIAPIYNNNIPNKYITRTTEISKKNIENGTWTLESFDVNEEEDYEYNIDISNEKQDLYITMQGSTTTSEMLPQAFNIDTQNSMTAIIKANTNKQYSKERIQPLQLTHKTTYEEAKATYMDAKNTGKSDKYLNNGGSGVDIAGGGN